MKKNEADKQWPTKVRFTLQERIWLSMLLPKEGDIMTLRILRVLRESMAFTPEEIEKWEIKQVGPGQFKWNPEANVGREYELGPVEFDIIGKTLRDLSNAKKLNVDCIDLYDRFVK